MKTTFCLALRDIESFREGQAVQCFGVDADVWGNNGHHATHYEHYVRMECQLDEIRFELPANPDEFTTSTRFIRRVEK